MKFTLAPSNPNDPFGDKPVSVHLPERSPTPGVFPLAASEFLPETSQPTASFDALGYFDAPLSPTLRFEKITLGPPREDDFAGLGDGTAGRSADFGKIALATEDSYFDLPATNPGHQPDASFNKSTAGEFEKFYRFTKVQETDDGNITVWGIATHEKPDLDGESCHYETAKDAYQAWSLAAVQRTSGAGQQISLGPIRYQHSTEPAGKATKIQYNDDDKEIWLGSVPINNDIRNQLQQGFLTGYSQGGSYAWRKCMECGKSLTLQQANNFCPACKKNVPVQFGLKRLSEVSYVDSPCTGKGFEYVKQDGSSRFVSFAKRAVPAPVEGVKVIASTRIFGNVWKHRVQLNGRPSIVLMRDDEILLVA